MSVASFVPRSLFGRIMLGATLWTVLALVVSAIGLTSAFRANAERGFRSLLEAHSYNVMGALERDAAGKLRGKPDLRDPRFQMPLSGWSWAAFDAQDRIASLSLARSVLSLPDAPFDDTFQRVVSIRDASGRELLVLEAQLFVDDGPAPVTVQVAGATRGIEESVADFERRLLLFFLLFGLGLLLATALVLRIGLKPLADARDQLLDIRNGEREALDEQQPREIQPLVQEVNALLVSNREVVERSRRQVGNLAHALKTPLTVLRNEAANERGELARTVAAQVDTMRTQVDAYLDRARIAALRHTARARTPVAPIVDGLLRTISKLAPDVDTALTRPLPSSLVFAGDASDLEEMLGNLLENASRFAKHKVRLSIETTDDALLFFVDDDGPGLGNEERSRALGRGVRLDERRSGSGLGLSIVTDIAEAYEGSLHLEPSPWGGLRARLALPYASPGR